MGMTTPEEQAALRALARRSNAEDPKKCGPSDDPLTHCNMDGVCEKHAKMFENQPREIKPLAQDISKRLSVRLSLLTDEVRQLEMDFQHEYDHNQELSEQLATTRVMQQEQEQSLRSEQQKRVAAQKEVELLIRENGPARFWYRIGLLGWLLASVLGTILATEIKSGEPIDKLVERVMMLLSN